MSPLYFQWHITDACNFRCRHCYQDNFSASRELDEDGLQAVADKIVHEAKNSNSKITINVTGGEPFLKKELFGLLSYLDMQDEVAQLLIITNGSLIDTQLIRKMRAVKKLNHIKISLEGSSSSTNDAIRPAGSFDSAVEAARLLKESGFCVSIMSTLMKANLRELEGLFRLCRSLGVDGLILERFFPLGEGANVREGVLDKNDWSYLMRTLLELTGGSNEDNEMFSQRAFWIKFDAGGPELWGADCNVGKDAFCIMPCADVYPCRRFTLRIGNLLENSLAEIMDSAILNDIVQGRKKGRCAECDVLGCRGCPALAYLFKGDYHGQDLQCAYKTE